MNDNNKNLTMEIESDVFQALIKHLQNKTEVQNIDLMNLADFCRNCLSKWYVAAAKEKGIEWKSLYQKEATKEQLEKFNSRKK